MTESRQKKGTVFLCQPIADVLMARGIEDVDSFIEQPSWNHLPDPFSIPSMEKATARVLRGIRNRERITIHGDYVIGCPEPTSYAAYYLV
jgi:hypothetical protein